MPGRVNPRPPRRVLMTADAVGGVWTYALDVASALARQRVSTVLAVLGPPPAPMQRSEADAAGVETVATGLPLDWLAGSPAEVTAAGHAVAELAVRHGADLVHLNSPALAARAQFPAPVLAVSHSCMATWWAAVRGSAMPADFAWRAALTGEGLRRADARVTPSHAFAAATAAAHGLPEPPAVVHNGRRMPDGPAAAEPQPGEVFAFTAGRLWDDGKNIAALDRAAALTPVPVFAAGPLDGPDGTRRLATNLVWLGTLDTRGMRRWLARRPLFVSLARYEPFGLAVLEAAQAGAPLVLSDIPTFRELWDGAAEFVPPGDYRALAGCLDRLAGDTAERERLGRAARERAGRYSVEAMAAGTLRQYEAALAGAAAGQGRATP